MEGFDGEFSTAVDSAFPISTTAIKGYLRPMEPRKKAFNKALSGLRTVCTENVIGDLKNRCPGIVNYQTHSLPFVSEASREVANLAGEVKWGPCT